MENILIALLSRWDDKKKKKSEDFLQSSQLRLLSLLISLLFEVISNVKTMQIEEMRNVQNERGPRGCTAVQFMLLASSFNAQRLKLSPISPRSGLSALGGGGREGRWGTLQVTQPRGGGGRRRSGVRWDLGIGEGCPGPGQLSAALWPSPASQTPRPWAVRRTASVQRATWGRRRREKFRGRFGALRKNNF